MPALEIVTGAAVVIGAAAFMLDCAIARADVRVCKRVKHRLRSARLSRLEARYVADQLAREDERDAAAAAALAARPWPLTGEAMAAAMPARGPRHGPWGDAP